MHYFFQTLHVIYIFLLNRLFIIVNYSEDGLVVLLKVSSCRYYGIII